MLKRYLLQMGSWIYRHTAFPLKKINVQRKTNSVFVQNTYFRNTVFEGRNFLDKGAYVANSYIGYGTNINRYSNISEAKIGRYCSIAPNVEIVIGQHPVKEKFVSTHAAFYSARETLGYTYRNETVFEEQKYLVDSYQVMIGNDVWIASDVRILAGVTIGDGAIIGACSLVTRDVEPYGIYVGIPAKKIGYRFDEDTVEKLKKIKWWEHDEAWMRKHVTEFDDVDSFVTNYQNLT
ncbi:MAG: CatB-related O-acetyltransferase [bacterium]|nr:CatB-related O-acetyltransferase [bacterium]